MKNFIKKVLQKILSKRVYISNKYKVEFNKSTLSKIIEEEKKTIKIDNKLRKKISKLKKLDKFKSVI